MCKIYHCFLRFLNQICLSGYPDGTLFCRIQQVWWFLTSVSERNILEIVSVLFLSIFLCLLRRQTCQLCRFYSDVHTPHNCMFLILSYSMMFGTTTNIEYSSLAQPSPCDNTNRNCLLMFSHDITGHACLFHHCSYLGYQCPNGPLRKTVRFWVIRVKVLIKIHFIFNAFRNARNFGA